MTTPNLERYRQGDIIQYLNNVLEIVTEARATSFFLVPQRQALQAAMEQLNTAWQPQVGSELTPEIAELDNRRDRVLNGLKLTVDNWAVNHYDPAWQNAAYIISDAIDGHGDRIFLMRYQQQTATINAIIQDLNNGLAGHLNTLGLGAWLAQLTTLNTAFNEKYVQRAQAVSGNQPGIVVELIAAATVAFRQLKTLFNARLAVAVVDGAANVDDFKQVENEWTSLTTQYNDAVSRYPSQPAEPNTTAEGAGSNTVQ